MNRVEKLMQRLATGEKILLDGATGTELERRDVPMVDGAWNSMAVKTHPDTVRQLHADYIEMGAEIIITNTFSSSKYLADSIGKVDEFPFLNRRAAELACEARVQANAPDVLVAGGMAAARFGKPLPPNEQLLADHSEQARLLAEGGADIIMLEMMVKLDWTETMIKAAQSAGLPVWVGYSCKVVDGVPQLIYGESLADAVALLHDYNVPAMAIMHTYTEDIAPCLDVVQPLWDNPICVYAHSGQFIQPNWIFDEVISVDDYSAESKKWLDRGVQIIGGCCGIGCDHIKALSELV